MRKVLSVLRDRKDPLVMQDHKVLKANRDCSMVLLAEGNSR